jgi:hypothetical protein
MEISKSLVKKMEKVSTNMDISEVPQKFKEKTLEAVEQLKREGKIIEETDGNLRLTELGKKNIHGILDNPAFEGIKNISFLEDTHCILCNKKLKDKGNNALPLADGRCCDECNNEKVIPARIENQKQEMSDSQKSLEQLRQERKITEKGQLLEINPSDSKNLKEILRNPMFKDLKVVDYDVGGKHIELDFSEEDVWFKFFRIPENDRFQTYQLLTNLMERITTKRSTEEWNKWKKDIDSSFFASLKQTHIFQVDNYLIPAFSHSPECSTALLPYKSTFLNARVPIGNRIYFGMHIGSYYMDNDKPVKVDDGLDNELSSMVDVMEKMKGIEEMNKTGKTTTGVSTYNAVLTCYLEEDKEGKLQIYSDIFPLFNLPSTIEGMFEPLDKYEKILKNFILTTLNSFSEPDVILTKHEFSKMNEERRIKKGRMPLPLLSTRIVVHGKLRIYIDKYNEKYEKSEGKSKRQFSHMFSVRANWFHFRNKKRYKKVYSLSDIDLDRLHYEKIKDRITGEDLIRVKRRECKRGEGLFIKKSYIVEE